MSGISILKSGLIASACVAGLTLSACASSNTHNDSRYGVADYEGGDECAVSPCGPVVSDPAQDSRYGSATGYEAAPAVVYQAPPAPAPAPAYTTQSTTTYTTAPSTTYSTPQYAAEAADCPAGTSRSGDGSSCMMSSSTSTYSGSSSYSTGSSYASVGQTVDCPPGTESSNDGTCMMSAGSTLSSTGSITAATTSPYAGSSASVYGSSSAATEYADCPEGSTRSATGSCTVSSGYVPSTTYTPPTTYLPIRK